MMVVKFEGMQKIERLVVVDSRSGGLRRVFDAFDCDVVFDVQDNGLTLKAFVRDPAEEVQE